MGNKADKSFTFERACCSNTVIDKHITQKQESIACSMDRTERISVTHTE